MQITTPGLLDTTELQRLLELFSTVHQVASIITSPEGMPVSKSPTCRHFCKDYLITPAHGAKKCFYSYSISGKINSAVPSIELCPRTGLWEAGMGILVGDKHVVNCLIGKVRDEHIDENRIIDYARELGKVNHPE